MSSYLNENNYEEPGGIASYHYTDTASAPAAAIQLEGPIWIAEGRHCAGKSLSFASSISKAISGLNGNYDKLKVWRPGIKGQHVANNNKTGIKTESQMAQSVQRRPV